MRNTCNGSPPPCSSRGSSYDGRPARAGGSCSCWWPAGMSKPRSGAEPGRRNFTSTWSLMWRQATSGWPSMPGDAGAIRRDHRREPQRLSRSDPRKPVDSVSWDDAEDFCAKLTAREHAAGRSAAGRTPTICPPTCSGTSSPPGTDPKNAVTSLDGTRRERHGSPSARARRTRWGCTTCWATSGSGAATGTITTSAKRTPTRICLISPPTPRPPPTGRRKRSRSCVAARGTPGHRTGLPSRTDLRYAPGMGNYRTGFRCVVEHRVASSSRRKNGSA